MAVVKKRYGVVPPSTRILVRIQEVEGSKILSTQSYAIFGQELADVISQVEALLDESYGDTAGQQEEEKPAPTPKSVVRKRRTR